MPAHFLAGDRMTGEGEDIEARQLGVTLGQHHESPRQIRQIGKRMGDVGASRPDIFVLVQRACDHEIEPRTAPRTAIEIPGPKHRRRHAFVARGLLETGFHGDTDRALPHRPDGRRVRSGKCGDLMAVIVDITGKQVKRLVRLGGGDYVLGQHRTHLRPIGVKRIEPVEDDVGTFGCSDQLVGLHGIRPACFGSSETVRQMPVAGNCKNSMACRHGGLRDDVTEAPSGAENCDCEWHF